MAGPWEDWDTWEPTRAYPDAPPDKSPTLRSSSSSAEGDKAGNAAGQNPAAGEGSGTGAGSPGGLGDAFAGIFSAFGGGSTSKAAAEPKPAPAGGLAAVLAAAEAAEQQMTQRLASNLSPEARPPSQRPRPAQVPKKSVPRSVDIGAIEAVEASAQEASPGVSAISGTPSQGAMARELARRKAREQAEARARQRAHRSAQASATGAGGASAERSPGWHALMQGWEVGQAGTNAIPGTPQSANRSLGAPGAVAAAEIPRAGLGSGMSAGQTRRSAGGTQWAPTGALSQTGGGSGMDGVRFTRVGTPQTEDSNPWIMPLVLGAAAVLLLLIGIGVGVILGQGMKPATVVTVTPSGYEEPKGVGEDSVGSSPSPSPVPTASPSENAEGAAGALSGLRIALDAGHNGKNGANATVIGQMVNDGRGGRKACDTTGTASLDGYPEHAFNFDVMQRVKIGLEAQGAIVSVTRDNNDGVGPCVDVRGTFAAATNSEVYVSIHANGSDNPSLRGFFAMVAYPALNDSQGPKSEELAKDLVLELKKAGFKPQEQAYPGAIWKRPDLAGLNAQTKPAVMLELGEMKNSEDASVMRSDDGRQRYADAIVKGLEAWAKGHQMELAAAIQAIEGARAGEGAPAPE
ncbi:MAG: N-acetylmuramoyl-L-alanine amidase [Actinomycetaceae bacterium]|nr:N-acetylmuramoyl-L-alanine amidase [Actinomycetaceae bacterium]